jgi:lipopolysaccharide transport system ATP-binding protein
MKPIIKVDNLSKRYTIGALDAPYATLRETLTGLVSSPLKRFRRKGGDEEVLWALKDLSFEIRPGEVVGVIGRNGAGKSTLLKILSRITEPTTGAVDLYGRVASLLEVGTGFHPELTGRENIFLNGSILGMQRSEIESKFDEIVAFSEVEKFLDTPVKRYSSGMYVRLAFAVAAHLEPEILVVDEVLAVGDAQFQKKCLGKMGDVARAGRTVLFVSHNMVAVKSLCNRAILLSRGTLAADGSVDDVVNGYLRDADGPGRTGIIADDAPRLYGTGEAKLRSVRLTDLADNEVAQLYLGQRFKVELNFEVFQEISDAVVDVGIVAIDGVQVTNSSTLDGGGSMFTLSPGRHVITFECGPDLLPRLYSFTIALSHSNGVTIEWVERALDFDVLRVAETGDDSYRWTTVRGYVRPPARWSGPNKLEPTESETSKDGVQDVVVGGTR